MAKKKWRKQLKESESLNGENRSGAINEGGSVKKWRETRGIVGIGGAEEESSAKKAAEANKPARLNG
jgi:hypothetical protein